MCIYDGGAKSTAESSGGEEGERHGGVRDIQKVLGVVRPEPLSELHEYLGVRAQVEHVDGRLLPVREWRVECNSRIVLQDAQAERAHSIIGGYARPILHGDLHAPVRVLDLADNGVQEQAWVILLQKCRRFALDPRVVAALVGNEVVLATILEKSEVVHRLLVLPSAVCSNTRPRGRYCIVSRHSQEAV
jgi:hypothetical protein